jgi:hypothetical protein
MVIIGVAQMADNGALENSVFGERHGGTLARFAVDLMHKPRLARQELGSHRSCWRLWLGLIDQPMGSAIQ